MKKTNVLAWVISLIIYGGVFFWVGKMSIPPIPEENSYEFILARAQARGIEQARLNHVAQQKKNLELANQQKEAEFDKTQQKQTQIEDMGLISVEDMARNWVEIGNGWKVRNLIVRQTESIPKGMHVIEFLISRTDTKQPRLTRIVAECFDDNLTFICPMVVDVSATDAQLSYIRPGYYNLMNRMPKYCRFVTAPVGKVKYRNAYPEDN